MPNQSGPVWRNEEERQVLAEVYKAFATRFDPSTRNPISYQEWFRGAGILPPTPTQQKRTLVINCNYRPLLMMKEVMGLAEKFDMVLELREVDPDGNVIKN